MILINIAGLLLIALIIYWFWLYKPVETVLDKRELVVIVENGVYQPAYIKLPSDQSLILKFLRKDASPCAETLLIPELNISEILPLNKIKEIKLPSMKSGEYAFHCQMQMYRGQINIE
jgi:plastocyanin domain-containing protein